MESILYRLCVRSSPLLTYLAPRFFCLAVHCYASDERDLGLYKQASEPVTTSLLASSIECGLIRSYVAGREIHSFKDIDSL
ncbi:hypothetical protein FRX31_007493 [Thalictrum thalictroides]|uniref:Uncharacterized protein n=1 Tax=Thalictrum thalictroides TaxID=46969 RepID=A0A7J6WZN2_THATH|nr:hypothetical protein FRX31_007493 [Thalictrum thalictroides]